MNLRATIHSVTDQHPPLPAAGHRPLAEGLLPLGGFCGYRNAAPGASAGRGAGGHFWAPRGHRLSPGKTRHQGEFGELPLLGLWCLPGGAEACTVPPGIQRWYSCHQQSATVSQGSHGWRGSPAPEGLWVRLSAPGWWGLSSSESP